jgi:ribosome-binding protein aMBF1 (putative translation factor)
VKICEICGTSEEIENVSDENIESVTIHICENCQEDRKWSHYENGVF